MADAVRVVDGDGHVIEDTAGIEKHLPHASWRAFFPPLDHLHAQGHQSSPGSFQKVGPAGWVDFMDDIGIDSAVLYPTAGLACGRITNPKWAIAVTRAYNQWLYETYVQFAPRLHGMALLPLQEPAAAVEELQRAVGELGMRGAMLPSTGLPLPLGAREYWPVYAEAERLGCALAVHGGSHGGLGMDNLQQFVPVHALGHPMGLMIGFASMVFAGVLDRFPMLRLGFLEGGIGWLPMCLERFDRSHTTFFDYDRDGDHLKLAAGERVSDHVRRHINAGRLFVGCEGAEATLSSTVRMVGSAPFVFSSDFPHEVNNAYCKAEIEEILEHEALTPADREAMLHGNAERFYGLLPG